MGVEDKIVNFFIGHKIPDVYRVYWFRRIEELRRIYAERQEHLNPLSQRREYDLNKLEDLKAKIQELEKRLEALEKGKANDNNCDVKVVTSIEQVVDLARQGYDCQPIGEGKWLMRRFKV